MKNGKRILAAAALFLCIIFLAIPVFGRAGGGGSSGGGGGGGSHGTHGSSGGRSGPLGIIPWAIVTGIAVYGGRVVIRWKAEKAKRKTVSEMKLLSGKEAHWNYRKIQKRVKKAYFEIQECWRRCDASYAKEYLSRSLMEEFQTKLSWMKLKGESPVQRNVRLLSAVLVDLKDEEGEEHDSLWYLIHGSMVGYYRNVETQIVTRGSTKQEDFYEYWRFILEDGKWVLDKICQKDELDLDRFADG